MWLNLEQYLEKIDQDNEKYYDYSDFHIKLTADMMPLDFNSLFKNDNKILKFEIGFGNGDSLIELARRNPHINYFGIDRKMDRIRTALSKVNRSKLPNLLIARTGTDYLNEMINRESFDEIIMNFPDPWPKKRHHKKRTVNPSFIKVLHSLLKKDGVFRFSSDHPEYSNEVIELFKESDLFENLYAPLDYKSEIEDRIMTQFEKHKTREGWEIHHMKYRKVEK
ncbi:MAG: tRNA (guanosine(46)-N7)-methyltransferase TrmB [Candidatus Cloacimonadota bacterium]|nr:MAG: tRNA (guanosine(46)-N7)-methyltransferase TrmB [Candidatus Cloacimonadota bacterium]PIE77996.1 MAG: tRNA (guanosine(46)-N7)-methyltransferase TrmB [Candidatus Delongbacteria bacterium]